MKRPLRIVHVFGSPHAGDWAFNPLKSFKESGHQVAAVCPADGPLPQRLRQIDISVYIVPFPRRLRCLRAGWSCVRELTSLFRRQHTDVTHCHLVPANLFGRMAAWMAAVPVRVTQWPGPMPLETPIGCFLEMSTVWMDRAVIASSTATKRIYDRYWHTRRKSRLIHYGLPLGPFDPTLDGAAIRQEFHIGEEEQVVALIAYIEPPPKHPRFGGISNKGHEIFIQAAREIRRSRKGVKFLIVGDYLYPDRTDDFKQHLREMVHQANLDESMIFTGYRSDVPQIIATTDIVVVPSQSENMGGAVEPLLMEKPVVASNVGGLPDIVIDGMTGFLVPPRDPQALAESVLRLLALPSSTRREMGRRGRVIVQSLVDLQITVQQTESLYYELLGHASG